MTRLDVLPQHLLPPSKRKHRMKWQTPPPADPTLDAEVGSLRATLSLCAGRMTCTKVSILAEVARVEVVLGELRELAGRI